MTEEQTERTEQTTNSEEQNFPIVGIGASAGGLDAFRALIPHLPADTGMAFVVIQHLSPDYESLLAQILAKSAQMPVVEIKDNMTVEPNHIYVIPPDTKLTFADGALHLFPRERVGGKYMPIDAFFTSLATEWGSQAIAIVLSGTDGDGSLGIEEVKARGGITFSQCEETAQFQGMPNRAAATGQVDLILPPQKIAEELVKFSRHPYLMRQSINLKASEAEKKDDDTPLSTVFRLLRNATGIDFTHYKRTTIKRRIAKRMALYKLDSLSEYVNYLEDSANEVQALYHELLIIVTQFFRDEEAFAALKEQVFPEIVASKSADASVRIWVPGCATGEEVYSLAICFLEFLSQQDKHLSLQIFGTDLSEAAIDKARSGFYEQSRIAHISPQRLGRFFVEAEGGYQISQRVREMCVFAKHDLSNDPPFSALDLISCRNVLIYFAPRLQKQVFPLFHYSLKHDGFLLLGASENVGEASELFNTVDTKHRIYSKKQTVPNKGYSLTFGNYSRGFLDGYDSDGQVQQQERNPDNLDVQRRADELVLEYHAPVGVLCTEWLNIIQFRGDVGDYLRPAPGEPSFSLLKMIRPELRPELQAVIHQAKSQDRPVRRQTHKTDYETTTLTLEVIPFRVAPAQERYLLILFITEVASVITSAPAAIPPDGQDQQVETSESQAKIDQLRQELMDSQNFLQASLEQQESINQCLTAANEEILSSNEELRSTNEELQTAKEEIQAANEELSTTNEELEYRNQEARQNNEDLLNLLNSVELPILILDNDLCIRRFTPAAQTIFNLIPADVGRPLSNIRINLNVPDLETLIIETISVPNILEREVQDHQGRWYSLRIRPYKTTENQINGAVVTLIDINDLRRNTQQLRLSRDYAEAIVETVREPLIVLNRELQVKTANPAFYEMFQLSPAQTEDQPFFTLKQEMWNIPQLRQCLEAMLPENEQLQSLEIEHEFANLGLKTMLINAYRFDVAEAERAILLAIEDITERQQFEAERTQLLAQEQAARLEAERANASKDQFISVLSHELRTPLNAIIGWSNILQKRSPNAERQKQGLEMIERNARLQSRLIEDLLDVSRIIRGEMRLEFCLFSVNEVIESALETVRLMAEDKNIQLRSELPSIPETVFGDPNRIQQVIWNLLSNAIKFTPEEGLVEVSVPPSDSSTQIVIRDTGRGIKADFLPHVFERFRQADPSSRQKQEGLGLGLAIVKELVTLHGGTIWVDSPGEGQGTTFTIELPLTTALSEADPEAEEAEAMPSLTGIKVLVVEDNPDALRFMTLLLEQQDAEVIACLSASEALKALGEAQPNVIVSDLNMPEMDGFGLLRQIRALPPEAGGEICAIALTADVSEARRQAATEVGFQTYLTKPVEIDSLLEAILNLVESSPSEA